MSPISTVILKSLLDDFGIFKVGIEEKLDMNPEGLLAKSLMRWFEKYTNKRLAQLISDVIRKRWQTIELEKAVDNIHQRQQP